MPMDRLVPSIREVKPLKTSRDPLESVMRLGGRHTMRAIVIGVLFALLVHGTAAARAALTPIGLIHWMSAVQARIAQRLVSTYEIDIIKPPEPPPPPPEEVKPEPEKAPPPPPVEKAEKEPPPEPPAPAAAVAGAALVKNDDSNEVQDFTLATGNGTSFAGGVTSSQGTATTAVRSIAARADGVAGGTGKAPAVEGPDRSRKPSRLGSSEMNCPWPPEADAEQRDEASVGLDVSVNANGNVTSVRVTNDPGHGFGARARTCAMNDRYAPAFDHDGNPIAVEHHAIRVHFQR
jgi:protein TonB